MTASVTPLHGGTDTAAAADRAHAALTRYLNRCRLAPTPSPPTGGRPPRTWPG